MPWPWPWPWIGSYGIPSCITHRPLCTYQISLKLEKLFLDGLTAGTPASSRSRDTKTRINFKNPVQWNLHIVLCLRISGRLPAPSVSGGGDRLWKVQFLELKRPGDLDLELGHTAYRYASLIDLYVHTKCHWNRTNFLWTDVPTDGRTFPL